MARIKGGLRSCSSLFTLLWLLQYLGKEVECYGVASPPSGSGHNNELVERSSRLFPLFSIVRISNQPCVPDAADSVGTCFTNNQCRNAGGVASGVCASGFGVCCIVTATCESVVTQNNTNIRPRDYPETFAPTKLEVCNVRIQKPTSGNVCQIRLDFTSLKLAESDESGDCMTDRLTINGNSGKVPPNLCGDLSGQHIYLDYGSSDRITLSLITDGGIVQSAREWNIRTTFIECNSLLRAPDGCLQYHTSATGQVRILGYPMAPHLKELDYTVCVRSEDGAGVIVWSPCQGEELSRSFSMTMTTPEAGTPGAIEEMCMKDYVLIMSDLDNANPAMPTNDDRYCGTAFANNDPPHMVRSSAKPFIMRVKTDGDEDGDMMNTGFCLAFRQEPPRPSG